MQQVESMMQDPGVTTDQLQEQATALVQQAQQVLPAAAAPDQEQMLQTGDIENTLISQAATPEAKNQIANLLGQISQLTGSKTAQSDAPSLDPAILA